MEQKLVKLCLQKDVIVYLKKTDTPVGGKLIGLTDETVVVETKHGGMSEPCISIIPIENVNYISSDSLKKDVVLSKINT